MLHVCSVDFGESLYHFTVNINTVLHALEGTLSDPFHMRFRIRCLGKRFHDRELFTYFILFVFIVV